MQSQTHVTRKPPKYRNDQGVTKKKIPNHRILEIPLLYSIKLALAMSNDNGTPSF